MDEWYPKCWKKEEYEARVKELEAIFNPIMMKIYQQNPDAMPNMGQHGAGPHPGAQPSGTNEGTSKGKVDDVD